MTVSGRASRRSGVEPPSLAVTHWTITSPFRTAPTPPTMGCPRAPYSTVISFIRAAGSERMVSLVSEVAWYIAVILELTIINTLLALAESSFRELNFGGHCKTFIPRLLYSKLLKVKGDDRNYVHHWVMYHIPDSCLSCFLHLWLCEVRTQGTAIREVVPIHYWLYLMPNAQPDKLCVPFWTRVLRFSFLPTRSTWKSY